MDNLVWACIMHTAVVREPTILVGRRVILGHKCVECEREREREGGKGREREREGERERERVSCH